MGFEGPNLKKPQEKTEKKPEDLAVEHISKGLAGIEIELSRKKFWMRLCEVVGGSIGLMSLATLALKAMDPNLEIPAGFKEAFSSGLGDLKTLLPLFSTTISGGISFWMGRESIRQDIFNAAQNKTELLKPYLNLPK